MTIGYIGRRLGCSASLPLPRSAQLHDSPPVTRGPYPGAVHHPAGYGGQYKADVDELIAIYEKKFGFDQPLWKQYLRYWGDVLRGASQPLTSRLK